MPAPALIAVAAIGAGFQYSASRQQAKSQSAIASLNAQNSNRAARQRFDLQMLNSRMESDRASQQAALRQLQGANLEAEADLADKAAMSNAAKSREEMARFRAIQRSRIAGSGVVESGTPLDALAESAADMELALSSSFYADSQKGRELNYEAGLAKAGASLLESDAAMLRIKGGFAKADLTTAYAQNNVERLAGMASARNTRMQGTASLIGNIGSMGMSAYNLNQNRPR